MPRGWRNRSANQAVENIHQHLNLYSAAAMAAGVSMLALAQPAEGSVVVTKTNVTLGRYSSIAIDLNKDGTNDFELSITGGGYDHSFYRTFVAKPLAGGKVEGGRSRGSLGPYASALAKGADIGPSAHFSSSMAREQLIVERTAGFESGVSGHSSYGKWGKVSNHYLGVKFLIKGATHYGWIRMTTTWNYGLTATITEYAYETIANKKIGAGSTTDATVEARTVSAGKDFGAVKAPSLGMLASGERGLALWRRDNGVSPTLDAVEPKS
jgi:hypothetical protein